MNELEFNELCNKFRDNNTVVTKEKQEIETMSKFKFKFTRLYNRFEFPILFILFTIQFFMNNYNSNFAFLLIQALLIYILVRCIFSK